MRILRKFILFGLALLWIGALVMQLGPHDAVDNVCHWLMSISCSAWVSEHHILRAIFWPLWLACVIWIFGQLLRGGSLGITAEKLRRRLPAGLKRRSRTIHLNLGQVKLKRLRH